MIKPAYIAIGAGVLILIAIAFFTGLFGFWDKQDQRHDSAVKNSGELQERQRNNEEVINAVTNANRPITDPERERVREKYDRNRNQNRQ